MAHRDPRVLEHLLRLLDDERNDVYLHVDIRAQDVDPRALGGLLTRAGFEVVRRREVNWGGYSQIATELALLATATRSPHRYYHLVSGADLPLAAQDEIHEFFAQHDGDEFVHRVDPAQSLAFASRVTRRHLFTEHTHTRIVGPARRVMDLTEAAYPRLQERLGVDVLRNTGLRPVKGAQWFSITEDLARYVVAHETGIRRTFRRSLCGDEFFLQTLVASSPFLERLHHPVPDDDYRACARKIDWERGHPYVWRTEDLDELLAGPSQGFMFARKFDSDVDAEIARLLYELLR